MHEWPPTAFDRCINFLYARMRALLYESPYRSNFVYNGRVVWTKSAAQLQVESIKRRPVEWDKCRLLPWKKTSFFCHLGQRRLSSTVVDQRLDLKITIIIRLLVCTMTSVRKNLYWSFCVCPRSTMHNFPRAIRAFLAFSNFICVAANEGFANILMLS